MFNRRRMYGAGGDRLPGEIEANPVDMVKSFVKSNRLNMAAAGLVAAAIGGTALNYTCTQTIDPGEQAVRQVDISVGGLLGEQGVNEKVYDAGKYFVFPGMERFHTFPADRLVLDMNRQMRPDHEDPEYQRTMEACRIETSDGFYVDLDVSIIYRITDPYKTLTVCGPGKMYEDNGIMPKAPDALKATIGQLRPEDIYVPKLRVAKQEEAKKLLNHEVAHMGLEVEHVLVRWPEFHPTIQKRIEDRAVAEQRQELNTAKDALRNAEQRLADMKAQGTKQVNEKLAEGTAYTAVKKSAQEKYVREKHSDGDKLVALAEAEATRLRNDAYQGPGAELLVGLKMAENLKNLEGIIIPAGGQGGFNPLDLGGVTDTISGDMQNGNMQQTGGDAQ